MIEATNIGFINPSTMREDETQFDTRYLAELKDLWWEFCVDNGYITYVEPVEVD